MAPLIQTISPSILQSLYSSIPKSPLRCSILRTDAAEKELQQEDGRHDGVCAPQDQQCAARAHTSRAPRARTLWGPRGTLTACGMATRRTQPSGSRRRPCRRSWASGGSQIQLVYLPDKYASHPLTFLLSFYLSFAPRALLPSPSFLVYIYFSLSF
jgi:hypothetical protein